LTADRRDAPETESTARRVRILPERMAISRLAPEAAPPTWAQRPGFSCIFRTEDSLTIVCPQTLIPDDIQSDRDWRCLEVEGPLELDLTGVLASLATPLAEANVPIFALSSFETDFVLVKDEHLMAARGALERAGFAVDESFPAR
jgi:hypothetical protein